MFSLNERLRLLLNIAPMAARPAPLFHHPLTVYPLSLPKSEAMSADMKENLGGVFARGPPRLLDSID